MVSWGMMWFMSCYTGGYDVVGSDIQPEYADLGASSKEYEDRGTFAYVPLDICSTNDAGRVIMEFQPDAVVHCAAWTAVDAAEDPDVQEKVYMVNVVGTRNIAEICRELGCKMIYISTDYVFDGQGDIPWSADCGDFNPQNVYGRIKLEGKQVVSELLDEFFIVRIA